RPQRHDPGGPRDRRPLYPVRESDGSLPAHRPQSGRRVKFRTEELRVVAEDRGEEVGSAELRVEGGEVWVEHLHARRPGGEEPLLRQALAQVRELERRLLAEAGAGSFGRVLVQTDDATAVEGAVRPFVPLLGPPGDAVVLP